MFSDIMKEVINKFNLFCLLSILLAILLLLGKYLTLNEQNDLFLIDHNKIDLQCSVPIKMFNSNGWVIMKLVYN